MKKFIVNMIIVMVILGFLECGMHARHAKPSNDLIAYHNKILHMHAAGDDQTAIVMQSQADPICIYTPLTYEQADATSLQKTYFLPRTKYADLHNDQMKNLLQPLGINLDMQKIAGKNYGLRMTFTMQSDDAYQIVKVVDTNKKTVRFEFVKKI